MFVCLLSSVVGWHTRGASNLATDTLASGRTAKQLAPAEASTACCALGCVSDCRRYEMVFEYTPTSDVLVESFWSFSIPSQGLVIPFLLVGHVTEPRVTLDRPAINFGRVRQPWQGAGWWAEAASMLHLDGSKLA